MFLQLLAAGGLAYLCAIAVIPLIRRMALARGLLDFPDGVRRKHARAVPRLGGVAIFVGFFVALTVAGAISGWKLPTGVHSAITPIAITAACAILFLIGLLDDLRGVPPTMKLLGQTLAALLLCKAGFEIRTIVLPPAISLDLGIWALPVTVVWLVGVSNAFNLVDGLDGLAGGVAVIALVAIGVAGAMNGHVRTPIYAAALAGGLLGFLRYNFPPARIFLGDSGSLVVGFLLAFLSVRGATRPGGAVSALVPIFALSYPLLDTGVAMLRRWLRGHPLSRADGRHIHHQLIALALGPRRALGLVCAYSAAIAVLGLFAAFAPPALTVGVMILGGAILVALFVFGARWLKYHEFSAAGNIVASARKLAGAAIRDTINARDAALLIGRAESLRHIDAILEDHAGVFHFAHMEIGPANQHMPNGKKRLTPAGLWKFEYPVGTQESEHEYLVLTIWCHRESSIRPANAERVAEIIGPAIAEWCERHQGTAALDIHNRMVTPVTAHPAIPFTLAAPGIHRGNDIVVQ